MSEIEDAIADGVVADLDASEAPPASTGKSSVHAGPGTSSMHYAPGTSQTGGLVAPLNGGSGTSPELDYIIPGGAEDTEDAEDADAREEREKKLVEAIAQARIDHAAADRSFRAFCKGGRPKSGYVAGLEHLQAKLERNEQ